MTDGAKTIWETESDVMKQDVVVSILTESIMVKDDLWLYGTKLRHGHKTDTVKRETENIGGHDLGKRDGSFDLTSLQKPLWLLITRVAANFVMRYGEEGETECSGLKISVFGPFLLQNKGKGVV
ncbi:hypothetical protein AB6A40_008298 [Gnathostoma spinigerum]|uniref:Uncharacterized protein n=1 Tax=Gnathostoma spinigerum TaxID=75299 RepID=A0ABD6EWF0_9BILA